MFARLSLFSLVLLSGLVACGEPDGDGDGFPESVDCDDAAAGVYPGAEEVCDGVDNDCDGEVDVDATDGVAYYTDGDSDGYGDDATVVIACEAPAGASDVGGDCNDADAAFNPGATEDDCTDPNDYNCDGSSGFADGDADGFPACRDCDDADNDVNPGAVEICDGDDNDCDELIDDADDDLDRSTGLGFYTDGDSDGFGDPESMVMACEQPDDAVMNALDCNDGNGDIHPGADEVCDEADNDCDGETDEPSAVDAVSFYADHDADGAGGPTSIRACSAPAGFVDNADDCDDEEAAAYPGNTEVCDLVDNDCDSAVDEDVTTTVFQDADGDTFGNASVSMAVCAVPTGYVTDDTDCNDLNASANPSATEVCDGIDNDCDTSVDDADSSLDESTASSWYKDSDGDGAGDPGEEVIACAAPSGYVANDLDCDDSDAGAIDCACSDGSDGDYSLTGGTASLAGGTYYYDDFSVAAGATLRVTGHDPLVIVANTIDVSGTIDASGGAGADSGSSTGPDGGDARGGGGGGGAGGDCGNGPGTGGAPNGGAPVIYSGSNSHGGSGGRAASVSAGAVSTGGHYGPGGGGGGGGASVDGSDGVGLRTGFSEGGAAFGTANMATVFSGGMGGAGGGANGGGGGAGGGAVALFAAEVSVSGTIDVSGGPGGGKTGGSCTSGGGGGGGGGMIWLHGFDVSVTGTLDAGAGAGRAASSSVALNQAGGNGAAGRIQISGPTRSVTGSVSPTAYQDSADPDCTRW